MQTMRSWIRLCEDADDIEYLIYSAMKALRENKWWSFWIIATGDTSQIMRWGHHENAAFSAFGESSTRRWDDKTEEEMQQQYGHLLPNWPRAIWWSDVAMANGWIRLFIKDQRLYINLMKHRATAPAKRVVASLITAVAEMAQEFVVEFNTGQDTAANNITVPNARQALRLVRSS